MTASMDRLLTSSDQRRYNTLMLGVLAMTMALLSQALTRTMMYDEAVTFFEYAVSPIRALFVYNMPNNHLLHSLAVWLTTTLMGDSLVAIRFTALAAAVLSVAMQYRLMRQIAHPSIAIVSACLLATLTIVGEYAVNARGYSLSLLMTQALVLLVMRRPRLSQRRTRYAFMGLGFVLILLLPSMIVLIVCISTWLLAAWPRRAAIQAILPMLLGCIGAGFFYVWSLLTPDILDNFRSGMALGNIVPEFLGYLVSTFGQNVILIMGLVGCGLLVGLRRLSALQSSFVGLSVSLLAGALVLAALQERITGYTFFARNYFFLLPLVCGPSALGYQWLLSMRGRLALASLALIFGAYAFPQLQTVQDVDNLVASARRILQPDDALVIGCCLNEPVIYMLQQEGIPFWQPDSLLPPERVYVLSTEFDLRDSVEANGLMCVDNDDWLPQIAYLCTPIR